MNNRMIPVPMVQEADDLETLAASINKDLLVSKEASWERLNRYRSAGKKLLKAKEQCKGKGRGAWGRWLEANFAFTERRAQQLMQYSKTEAASVLEDEEAQWQRVSGHAQNDADEDDEPERPPQPASNASHDAGEKETRPAAPPKQEPVRTNSLGLYVTGDQWKGMSEKEQRKALATAGTTKFNDQADNDNIEWALWSWNPVTGCKHDCPYCYARDIAERFYEQKFEPSLWPGRLKCPQNTPIPAGKIAEEKAKGTREGDVRAIGLRNVFVCSMADLFGRWVPSEWIEAVLEEVRASPQWTFLFLTKFPIRMAEFDFPENTWVGTTVDCQARVANAERAFRKVKAGVKWLSLEPLIEPLKFTDLGAFDWVVIGGSSRSTKTPEWMPPRRWVTDIEQEVWRTGGKVYEKSNLFPSGGWERIRQYPGVDDPADLIQAPEELRYLPGVENKQS